LKTALESNMPTIVVTLETSQLEMSVLKAVLDANMYCILITLETSQLEMSVLKAVLELNMLFILITLETFQLEMSELKAVLELNMLSIVSTLETSQLEMFSLNKTFPPENKPFIWVTIVISHVLISLPYVVPPAIYSVTALLILMLRSLPPQVKSSAVMPVLGNDD
jgi:hypothetical protein